MTSDGAWLHSSAAPIPLITSSGRRAERAFAERECEELLEPDLGTVTLTGRLFGDRATYSCQLGYHVVGLRERTCQADGTWSGDAPACKQNVYCTSPPVLEHARHSALPEQQTFALDSTLQYQCVAGYITRGFPRAKCLAIDGSASWFGPDISCDREYTRTSSSLL
ncbi:protein lev-9-like [Schistocerca americana]|uniref:protein lev-9-like n=1 Tax=Schistocerca americana TaxID=7009 RepID=UPI001F4FC55D|nr:protein lev-9-like [Schistocerca americana]